MNKIGSKIQHPILMTLAALVLVFSAVGVEQAAAQEGLPRTPLIEQGPADAPYNPPAVNDPSERVMQSDQSFQLDRGIGNNPTNRDEYVREQLSQSRPRVIRGQSNGPYCRTRSSRVQMLALIRAAQTLAM